MPALLNDVNHFIPFYHFCGGLLAFSGSSLVAKTSYKMLLGSTGILQIIIILFSDTSLLDSSALEVQHVLVYT